MFKIKSKLFNNNILESITFEHSNIENLIEFTIDKSLLVSDNSQLNNIKHSFVLDGLKYNVLIFSEVKTKIGYYSKNLLKRSYFSVNEIIITYIDFCTDSDSAIDFANNFFVYITVNFEDFLSGSESVDKYEFLTTELTTVDGNINIISSPEYDKRVNAFNEKYNTQHAKTFKYIGLGSKNDMIKVYIKDLNNNIIDGNLEIAEVELGNKQKYSFLYSKILIDEKPVRIIISKIEFLFYLLQNECLILDHKSPGEKIKIPLSLGLKDKYNIQFLESNLFVFIFTEDSFVSLVSYKWKINPNNVLENNLLKYSEYQKNEMKSYFGEMDELEAMSNDLFQRQREYDHNYDGWDEMDDEGKRWNDPDRWMDDQIGYADMEDGREDQLENIYISDSDKKKYLLENHVQLDIYVLFFNFVVQNKKRSKYKKTDYLEENGLIELTCIIPAEYNDFHDHEIKKVYLKEFLRWVYIGYSNPYLFAYINDRFYDVSSLNDYFNVEFKLEGRNDENEYSNGIWGIYKGKIQI